MNDTEFLFLVLAAVYLLECIVWTPRNSVVFHSTFRRSCGIVDGNALAGIRSIGFLFANPVPPFSRLFHCSWPPLSLSPHAVYAYSCAAFNPGSRPEHSGRFIRLDEITRIEVRERRLLVNGTPFVEAVSVGMARHLGEFLQRLRKLPEPKREEAIEVEMRRSLASDLVSERLDLFRRSTGGLRIACIALFAYLFVLCPIVIHIRGIVATWKMALIGLALVLSPVIVEYFLAHRKLYPSEREGLITSLVGMVLAPPAAIQAYRILSRNLLSTFHPLAVSSVLCPTDGRIRFARGVVLDTRHPILPCCPSEDPGPLETERWFRQRLSQLIEREVGNAGEIDERLLAPPAPDGPGSVAYCPRCTSQFVVEEGTCIDCGDRPLKRFVEVTQKGEQPGVRA